MKNKIIVCLILNLFFSLNSQSLKLELEILYSNSSRTSWKLSLNDKDNSVGYLKFFKKETIGFIDLFYVDINYRHKNNDLILMINALDKLFIEEDVDVVYLSPTPLSQGLNLDILKRYYQKKFGFEFCDNKKLMCLDQEEYLIKFKPMSKL
jgi:hypothetical protein